MESTNWYQQWCRLAYARKGYQKCVLLERRKDFWYDPHSTIIIAHLSMCVQKQADGGLKRGCNHFTKPHCPHRRQCVQASPHLLLLIRFSDFIQKLFIVQRVRLIGEPPKEVAYYICKMSLYCPGTLKIDNVLGNISLASCLSGGDLDTISDILFE